MKRAQSSIEVLISFSILLLMLIVMYELSHSMSVAKDNIASQFEGEKVAAQISGEIYWAAVAGKGTQINVSAYSYPEQTIITSGQSVLSLGPQNNTLAVALTIANITNRSGPISSNQNLKVIYNDSNISISALN
ncbi:MAG: hypothetical protein WC492_03965 [Candidatus Micrarchaeia archaeon]